METIESNPVHSQGPVVGIIIVVIVLLVGAFFFFTRMAGFNSAPMPEATTTDGTTLSPTSTSDDPDAIANDLNEEDFSGIDAEIDDLNAEFGY